MHAQHPVYTAAFGNTWAGRQIEAHLDELYHYSTHIDVGFFSEVLSYESESGEPLVAHGLPGNGKDAVTVNQFQLMRRYLDGFTCEHTGRRGYDIVCHQSERRYPGVHFGNARCFRDTVPVVDHGSALIFGQDGVKSEAGINPRGLDYVVIGGREPTVVAHLHGLWIEGNTKGDAPERDAQSREVRRMLGILREQHSTDRIILGGDFNLDHNTRALAYLETGDGAEDLPLRNLIREYGITSTRTSHYRKYGVPGETLYADYVLVSEAIDVVEFSLRPESASDHMHLLLSWR